LSATAEGEARRSGPSQRGVEGAGAIVIALFGAAVVIGGVKVGVGWGEEGPKSGFFPFYVGLAILASSAINFVRARAIDVEPRFATWTELRQVGAVVWPTTLYVAVVPWIGIYLSSIALVTYFMIRLGRYGVLFSGVVAAGVMAAIYLTFETWFLVPLPKGPIEELLGL